MLSIGEFSQAAKITVKALRHYHELGLLAPELVDEETGYRYYGWKSFERARAINGLKEMGFSLSQIGELIAGTKEDSELAGPLREKLQEIEEWVRQQRGMQRRIREFLAGIESTGDEPRAGHEVSEEDVPETLLFGLRHQGSYQDIGRLISVVYGKAGRQAAGPPFCLYYDGEYKEEGADYEVCVPARRRLGIEGLDCRLLPGGRAAVLVHVGPYELLGKSYGKLYDYVRERKKGLQLPIREEYQRGPGFIVRGDPARYRTKIMLLLAVDEGGFGQMRHAGGAPSGLALDVERTIGPDASCTHIPFPFSLDRDAEGLEISFSYAPETLTDHGRARELFEAGMRVYADSLEADGDPDGWRLDEPLMNLLTLSLDGPAGFRGCAHRQSSGQHITLNGRTATPGFIPGNVEAGQWRATISVHLVVTETCGFRLQIRAL